MAGSGTSHLRPSEKPLLTVENLTVEFPARRRKVVSAVSNLSFDLLPGETLGLVGESGCGKSSTGKAIIQLPPPTSGTVTLGNTELTALSGKELRQQRTRLQMIFQDPISSLNPRKNVFDIVEEPLRIWNLGDAEERDRRVTECLHAVGVDVDGARERKPHEFSGGQCQRISIARAVVTEPELIICDEPVSALDVLVQAQILNLLEEMKQRFGLTLVFVAHDLAVVKNISDRVAVMYLGKMCEIGPSEAIFSNPAHPYTEALLNAIPVPDPSVQVDSSDHLRGDLPSPIDPPAGCRFHTRCERATDVCSRVEPQMAPVGDGHYVACHHPLITPVEISGSVGTSVTPTG